MAIALDQDIVQPDLAVGETRQGLPFSFHGKASEYFGIWIVNLLLSIVTLGIYSAWAKVRTKRYFYGNTQLDGSSFDYLASPLQILKGRLIVFAVLIPIALLSAFSPLALLLYIPIYFLLPWFAVKALKFNAQNSAYRNVRFNFDGKVSDSYIVYLLLPIASFLTLGLLVPYLSYAAQNFRVDNARYGQTRFAFDGRPSGYYRYYGIAVLLGIAVFAALIGLLLAFAGTLAALAPEGLTIDAENVGIHATGLVAFFPLTAVAILFFLIQSYLTIRVQNYAFDTTRLGDHNLALDLKILPYMWIRLTNLIAIVISVGLLIPWAQIRMARYQIENMRLIPNGDLKTLVDNEQKQVRALGEEFGEGMDMDLGLGV